MNDLNDADNALLDLAREGHEPTSADRSRVRAAIAAQLGLGASLVATSAGAGGVGSASTSLVAAATKLLVATVVVGGLTGAVSVAYKSMRPAAVAAPVAAMPVAHGTRVIPAPPASVALSTAVTVPSSQPQLVDREAPREVPPVPVRRSPEFLSPPPYARGSGPLTADGVQSASSLETSPAQVAVVSSAPATSDLTAPAGPPSTAPPLPPTTLEAETRLVGAGVAALHSGDAARALSLFDDHARQFPDGALAQERMVERIAALCALGRQDQARSAAGAFIQMHGGSPLVDRVRSSCGGRGAIP